MMICALVLALVYRTAVLILTLIRTIVETVCGWVETLVHTVKEVVQEVCDWLPWPLDALCNWVTTLIDVFEWVWEWVCTVITRVVIDTIQVIITYLTYVLKWVCWLIDLPFRVIEWLACILGIRPRQYMLVCIRILTDAQGVPAVPEATARALFAEAQARLTNCGIQACLIGLDFLRAPGHLTAECGAAGFFSSGFEWFSSRQCVSPAGLFVTPITVFFVRAFVGNEKGCGIPGTDFVLVGANASNATMAHEIGHLCDLWHSDDPTNVMFSPSSDQSTKFEGWQCCTIRSSEYASLAGGIGCDESLRRRSVSGRQWLGARGSSLKPKRPANPALPPLDQKPRGLGDTIARLARTIGIKPCGGCAQRAEWLNRLVSFDRNSRDLDQGL